jgi:hypothetical protein
MIDDARPALADLVDEPEVRQLPADHGNIDSGLGF